MRNLEKCVTFTNERKAHYQIVGHMHNKQTTTYIRTYTSAPHSNWLVLWFNVPRAKKRYSECVFVVRLWMLTMDALQMKVRVDAFLCVWKHSPSFAAKFWCCFFFLLLLWVHFIFYLCLCFLCVIFFFRLMLSSRRSSFTVFQFNLSFMKSLRLWIVADCMFYSSFFNVFYLKHICLALVIVTMCLCFHQLFSQTHKIWVVPTIN